MDAMINGWLSSLSGFLSANMWLAPLLALFAGVLTSFTPCCLSSVPLVIGYVGATENRTTKHAFQLSAVFAGGMAVTLTALGTVSALLGKLLQGVGSWWYILLGILMVLMALQTWEVYSFIPSTYLLNKNKRRGYLGAFLAGMLGGLFSSPCATPVLVAILAIVAREGNPVWGTLLLLLYSLGHSTLVLIAGTSLGFVKRLSASGKYGLVSSILKYLMGAALLLLAFYLFYLGF